MGATQKANKRLGTAMEKRQETERDGRRTPDTEWHDVMDDGTPVEVKSTPETVENPKGERTGRYQLIAENHEKLVENGGEYDFLLRNENNEVIEVETMDAMTVDKILARDGRKWPENSKLKIMWTDIHGRNL